MATVTKPIALDESFNTTEVTPRNIADVLAEGFSHITGRTASEVEYDNTESGLDADNVQDALDEINGKIPTVPSVDIQTAVDEFETYNGGLLSECIIELVPVQSGSGDPSPDNVRPISGHTQVVVGDDGKNWLKNTASSTSIRGIDYTVNADGTVDADGTSTQNGGIVVFNGSLPNGNYILNGSENGSASTYTIRYNINGGTNINVYSGDSEIIALTDTDVLNVEIRVYQNVALSHVLFKPMIRLASDTDPTFVPYNGYQVTVNLGGTYYSGTLDVVSGGLMVDKAKIIIDENSAIYNWNSPQSPWCGFVHRISDQATGRKLVKTNYTTSIDGNYSSWNAYSVNQDIYVCMNENIIGGRTIADMTAYLATHPLEVVYELATPQTIQLSPTMVKALVGENHLSAPLEGQTIDEVKYKQMFTFDDVIAYIQSLS